MDSSLCVVLHDVSPVTWPACQRVIDAVGEVGPVPLTLLAVPRYHGASPEASFDDQLSRRCECGDELALHGYTHRDDGRPAGVVDALRRRWYTAGEGEFAALPADEALRRLRAGAQWFRERGWPLFGFVAPAWLMSAGTWQALAMLPLTYTATLRRLYALPAPAASNASRPRPRIGGWGRTAALPARQVLTSQSIVYSTRASWRRATSLVWNRALHHAGQDSQLLVRFELHPHDADYPAIRRSWQRLLAWHLQYRRAYTVAEFVRHWQGRLDLPTAPMAYHPQPPAPSPQRPGLAP